jgi:urease accessory protein
MDTDKLLPLLQAFDALYPVGSFAFSGGLETYTQQERVADAGSLAAYVDAWLCVAPGADLGSAALAARLAAARCGGAADAEGGCGDFEARLTSLDKTVRAYKTAYEIRRGSRMLCTRFLKMAGQTQARAALTAYEGLIGGGACTGQYPVAAGLLIGDVAAGDAGCLREGLLVFAYAQVSAMVNHAAKMVPLANADGQRVLAQAGGKISAAVDAALGAEEEQLGVSGFGFELRAMQHETLEKRLYQS